MGYRSDVSIICEKKTFEMLKEAWERVEFYPHKISQNETDYLIEWNWVKWYNNFKEVEAIEKVLSIVQGVEYDDKEGYAYKQIMIGEDNAFDEYSNLNGYEKYDCDFYIAVTVEKPDDFVETETYYD